MKAISLWQPWASLIALGLKRFETRSWPTSYRGPLLICAGQRKPQWNEARDVFWGLASRVENMVDWYMGLPYGKAVAVVDLASCIKIADHPIHDKLWREERAFGDFTPGRFAWELQSVQRVRPFPVRGRQRLFEVPDAEVYRHLGVDVEDRRMTPDTCERCGEDLRKEME